MADGGAMERANRLRSAGEQARGRDRALACRNYEEAVALLRGCGEGLLLAHTVRHLGDVRCEAGEWEEAGPCYVEALALYRAHPAAPAMHLANALRAMAVWMEHGCARAEARGLWEEARGLYAECGIAAGVAECERRMSER